MPLHYKHGSVMIITMLILLAILLGFAFIGAVSIRSERGGVLTYGFYARARAAANACMETAIDRLGRDASYTGDESVDIGNGNTCTIHPIEEDTHWTIKTESQINDATVRMRAVLSSQN
ncbi:hypothetical protein GF380_02890, partial [Candidatus Uhrbacteria bacterium]|nr:hypothetical protein [Candidatus Uhrbacteria bacterium]MBD3284096.1 hypothetical protein [Candidatus Uhrbacteria bacterium]